MTVPIVLAALLRPDDDRPGDIRSLVRGAVELERAGFTFVVVDAPAPTNAAFEPYTLAASLAFATHRLGFAVTSATTGLHPYHAARRLASFDHLSGGRAAWFVEEDPDRGHAVEYVDVARALWDSWDDDAFVRDVDEGRYYDPAGLHTPEYSGSYYRVRGPLNISRPPQGHIVVIQGVSTVSAEPDLHADVLVVDTTDHRIERHPDRPKVLVRTPSIGADELVRWQRDGLADGVLVEGTWTPEHVRELVAIGSAFGPGPDGRRLRDRLGLARPERRDHALSEAAR